VRNGFAINIWQLPDALINGKNFCSMLSKLFHKLIDLAGWMQCSPMFQREKEYSQLKINCKVVEHI
jgi:uncharacterized membrane protein YuzA (DUF378 family)